MALHCWHCGDELALILGDNGDTYWVHRDNAEVRCVMEAKAPKGSFRDPKPVTLDELKDEIARNNR